MATESPVSSPLTTASTRRRSRAADLPLARTTVPRRRRPRNDLWLALLFIAPAAIGFVVFLAWPTVRGIYLSFTSYNLLTEPEFTGLQNYARLMQDSIFWHSMVVTIEYVLINIVIQTVVALFIAVMMHRLTKSTFVRGIVLAPYLVSNVVAALVWLWILDTQLGIGNEMLAALGLDRIPFLQSDVWGVPSIALINVWRHVGYTALLIFAGLQSLPETVYEAGRIDGASEWKMFWRITVPLLRPILSLVLIITVIGSFQVFDTVAVTTQGGPANATNVVQNYIYNLAFGRFQFGYASAVSVALLIVLSIITIIQYRLTRSGESDLD